MRQFAALISLLAICLTPTSMSFASEAAPTPEFQRSHQVDILLQRLVESTAKRDLDSLESLLDAIQTSPDIKTDATYDAVARRFCEALSTTDFSPALNERRNILIERAAMTALATHPNMPIESRAYFLSLPMVSDAYLSGDGWAKRRESRVAEMLSVWSALAAKQPTAPPKVGTSPTPDTAVLAYLETSDGKKGQSLGLSDEQRREINFKYYSAAVESYLATAYARPPYSLAELRSSLATSGLPKDTQWRVLGKVIYAMHVAGAPVD